MNDEEEIPIEDSTPSILEQAMGRGWIADYYNFGLIEKDGNDRFNPALIERPDGLWMLVRQANPHPQGFEYGQNDIWAFMMDDAGKVPKMGKRLRWMITEPSQQFEDPRGFYHPALQQVLVGACSFVWYQNAPWTGPHQCFGAFEVSGDKNQDWTCKKMDYPQIGGNPGDMGRIEKHENYEKNWLWWLHEGKLHLLYKARPWQVYIFGQTWSDVVVWKNESGATWQYGDIRGGTTPLRVGDYYFTFHHSSLPWKGRYRRYYAGCVAFEAKPPYNPKFITSEPILTGSQNDTWTQKKPLVVFPCGSLYRKGEWLISCGINDLRAAWIQFPHEELLKLMKPIGDAPAIFPQSGLSKKELLLQKLRANAAKARAAKAAKKAGVEVLDATENVETVSPKLPTRRRKNIIRDSKARRKALLKG